MSTHQPQPAVPVVTAHRGVQSRRTHERLTVAAAAAVAAVLAMAITVAMPKPNFALVIGLLIGVAAILALMLSTRHEVTVAVLVVYLGLLDGPVKLESASQAASGVRDVLILAVALGIFLRAVMRGQGITMPPLSNWVLAFVAVVLIEAANPHTSGVLKVLAGYRQQLEWVPFFFFGYLLMRSKDRFRKLFLILGVIALANGLVGVVQSRLSPGALSSWGPGYGQRLSGKGGGRTYIVEGEAHPRPPALGSDAGFGGGVGVLALPGLLALLAAGRLRRRWPVLLCCVGALMGVATAASRTSVVTLVMVLGFFGLLSLIAGLRVGRPLLGLIVVAVIGIGVGSVLVAADGAGIFKRQEGLGTTVSSGGEEHADGKEKHLSEIPSDIAHSPFGFGLGTVGSVAGFGGKENPTVEEKTISGGSAYNLLIVETGAPGLLLWLGLTINTLVLALPRLRRVADPELRMYIVAMLAAFLTFTMQGLAGTTLAVSPAGVYLWFVPGVIAFWFAGPGRRALLARRAPASAAASSPAPAVA